MRRFGTSLLLAISLMLTNATFSTLNAWVGNGNAVCTAQGWQWMPKLRSDDDGGAIITWYDIRSGSADIYAQRLTANGRALWPADGSAVCSAAADQLHPRIAKDRCHGSIIAWWDNRYGDWDLYVQRINALGETQWEDNGIVVCSVANWTEVSQGFHDIIPDNSGGAILIWTDNRNGNPDIYAQRISSDGLILWEDGGVPVCTASGDQGQFQVLSGGAEGTTVTWTDYRNTNSDIYVQRIDASGIVQWDVDGVAVCSNPEYQYNPQIASDGHGGAIITWWDYRRGEGDLYAQRVKSDGSTAWAEDGIAICTAPFDQGYYNLQIVSDDSSSAVIAWEDVRNGDWDIYAQKIDSSGNTQWTPNGIAICTAPGDQGHHYQGAFALQMTPDGHGGAVISWLDARDSNLDVYAQLLGADGTVAWAPNGTVVCNAGGDQDFLHMSWDDHGGAIIAWVDFRNAIDTDIYAGRIGIWGPIATTLQSYSASYTDKGVKVEWSLSDASPDCEFHILRACQSKGGYRELAGPIVDGNGLSFSFVDDNCEPGMDYWYRVEMHGNSDRMILFEAGPASTPIMQLALYQNHPNPFNPSTAIKYYVPEPGEVTLGVYDARGRLVVNLVAGERQERGNHTVTWNGRGATGQSVMSGVYFCRLKAGKAEQTKKMVLLR